MHRDFGLLVDYFRGELDASQAQLLRERLEHDADLFALWDRLKRTYAVIRSLPAPAPRVQAEPSPTAELPLTTPRPAYVADLRREFEARGWSALLPALAPSAAFIRGLRIEFSVRSIIARLPQISARAGFVRALRTEFGVRATAARLPAMNVRPAYARMLRAEFSLRALLGSLPLLEPSERFKRRLKVALYEASREPAPAGAEPAPAMPKLEPSDPFRRRLFAAVAKARNIVLRPSRMAGTPRGRELAARVRRSKSLVVMGAIHVLTIIIAFFITPVLARSQPQFVANVRGQYEVLPEFAPPRGVGVVHDPRIDLGPPQAPRLIDDPRIMGDPDVIGLEDPRMPLPAPLEEPPREVAPEFRVLPPSGGAPVDAQAWYRLRTQPREKKIEYLGSAELYEALDRALMYLRRTQDQDGGWGHRDVDTRIIPAGAELREVQRIELSAAALLAYLGDGHSSRHSPVGYDFNVSRGIKYLLSRQQPDGQIGPDALDVVHCHALATLALLEDYALTGDVTLKQPVRNACRWLAQSFADGGGKTGSFPYRRGQQPSLMTSVWAYLALASARNVHMPEADVPKSRLEALMAWFAKESRDRAVLEDQTDAFNGELVPTAAAAALTAFAGDEGFELRRQSYLERVAREPVDLTNRPAERMRATADMRYAFFGSLAHALGGGGGRWGENLNRNLLRTQARDGFNEGSYESTGYYADLYGRVFSTAFAALSIENTYRVAVLRGK